MDQFERMKVTRQAMNGRMCLMFGGIFLMSTIFFILEAIVVVLPVPAPALIREYSSSVRMAFICSSSR